MEDRLRTYWRGAYYQLKPLLPWRLRIALRRIRANRRRQMFAGSWPVSERAAKPPANWPGWPGGKRFAFVLTHDVEGSIGVERCPAVLELEKQAGFRSCFNFVPEGDYSVAKALRDLITEEGFEVGVHDLRHDGKLYQMRESFQEHARSINEYLKDWNAVGFRSAFMLHELSWLHDLNILYDASTFDTDPFEPQPDGVHTIFPFWVAGAAGRGYVELPYTLVQDFTLFIILRERSPEIWKRKLDWVVEKGGMALLDTHPDYMAFNSKERHTGTYPADYYREFLEYVAERYAGEYWHPLPREMAAYINGRAKECPVSCMSVQSSPAKVAAAANPARKIWIDLDNTPHVPFFLPIIAELRSRGYEVMVSARDAFQVCELCDLHRVEHRRIGRHYGKNKIAKVLGLFFRASQLVPFALAGKPVLGLSHGSRSQMIACNLLGIPTILVADYEHAKTPPMMRSKWEIVPESIPNSSLHCRQEYIRKYSGIKEDVYAWTLVPDSSILNDLSIKNGQILVLMRPPANEAHYHNPESEILFERAMIRLCADPLVRTVLLPRNRRQEEWIRGRWPDWFTDGRVVVPQKAVDGLNLIWHADLVISGGGTMNRESAALGVPVYSIFRGPTGAVDRHLQAEGRLTMITSPEEVDTKISIRKKEVQGHLSVKPQKALADILAHIESILDLEEKARR